MRRRLQRLIVVTALTAVALPPEQAVAAPGDTFKLDDADRQIKSILEAVKDAETAAASKEKVTEETLAKRLVEGQIALVEGDAERSAIIFLDLLENHPGTGASRQALFFLGEALVKLGMPRWAAECFSGTLRDTSKEASRFHHRSVARMFDLSVPRRKPGFARRPGLSATPEMRARLKALGVSPDVEPPAGLVSDLSQERLVRWAEAVAANREPTLSYSYGRYLFLKGDPKRARAVLDRLAPPDEALSDRGEEGPWRIRASYVAAAASLSMGEIDDAIARFERVASARPTAPRDQAISELSWMAMGRIHHDRKETDDAVVAYRHISRDSPFFPEAMYETAWTLLRGGRNERAIQALDLLLVYDPDSPIVPEIKQLRGKIKIQERDWAGAEREFLALRREFSELAAGLEKQLVKGKREEAAKYFSAVVAEDMQHFSFEAIMPLDAAKLARTLPQSVQSRDVVNELGAVESMLTETRDLLSRMETAVRARERARLFSDLGASLASLDAAGLELVELQEDLVKRGKNKIGKKSGKVAQLEQRRKALRKALDRNRSANGRAATEKKLRSLGQKAHRYELTVAALRAQLVATERYYEETKKRQKIDPSAYLTQASALRDEIAALEGDARAASMELAKMRATLHFTDPWQQQRRLALAEYSRHLQAMWNGIGQVRNDPEAQKRWNATIVLQRRVAAGRTALDGAALKRLRRAIQILREERINLDRYRTELTQTEQTARTLTGEVMDATYRDVVGEVQNLVTRSEVGLLDVAWAIQDVEAESIRRLETARDRDTREIDNLLEELAKEGQP